MCAVLRRSDGEKRRSVPDVHVSPAGRDVAALAILPERTPMYISTHVTADAVRCQLEGRRFRLVAGFANDLFVGSGQRKFRLPRMIKTPACPAVGIVATAAATPKPPLVEILVTFFAGSRRVLVHGRPVAFLARNRGMQSDQRETRQLVIECQILSPIRVAVASFAPLAELAFVRVLLAVAGNAGRCEPVAV